MSETVRMTLTDFLLARIAEDEERARSAGHGCGYLHEHNAGWAEIALPEEHNVRPSYELRFIRHNSPARVLAECEAKRNLIQHLARLAASGPVGKYNAADEALWCTLRTLANVYADHPDFRYEWRP